MSIFELGVTKGPSPQVDRDAPQFDRLPCRLKASDHRPALRELSHCKALTRPTPGHVCKLYCAVEATGPDCNELETRLYWCGMAHSPMRQQ
jgi:hypothetical protein